MAGNRKPRKQHKRREIVIPMTASTKNDIAMRLHAAVETLIHAPSIETYNHISQQLILLAQAGGKSQALEDGKLALIEVAQRYDRVGKVGISEDEARRLRLASGGMDGLIGKCSINQFVHAEIQTAKICEKYGI